MTYVVTAYVVMAYAVTAQKVMALHSIFDDFRGMPTANAEG